jgi:hypothetical protein
VPLGRFTISNAAFLVSLETYEVETHGTSHVVEVLSKKALGVTVSMNSPDLVACRMLVADVRRIDVIVWEGTLRSRRRRAFDLVDRRH